jgi:ferrous iron transport protein B
MTKYIALIGNPNVGKTVIFNALTGSRQHVGNWPGVTVEKKEGSMKYVGQEYHIVDLPGTYSLTPHAVDERIARDYLLNEKPDVVVDIVDASNLERNLYLTSLLMEAGVKIIMVLNKMDAAQENGYNINVKQLSDILGYTVIPATATKGEGIQELKEAIYHTASDEPTRLNVLVYGGLEKHIQSLEGLINKDKDLMEAAPARWTAIRLLENDAESHDLAGKSSLKDKIREQLNLIGDKVGDDLEMEVADARYSAITKIAHKVVLRTRQKQITTTDMLDKVLLDKHLAIPIFLTLMWATFQFTFECSGPFMDLIDFGFAHLGGAVDGLITNEWLNSLLVDGIIGGWGFILIFIPPIMFLFLALSFLEDTGYLARAAFVMDKLMYKLGLHGRSFIPMLMGFGCNVPAIMATRSIEGKHDRLITILVNPLMSCGARLPVYILFAGAFFGSMAGSVIFSMYVLGIVLAIVMSLVFRKFLFPGKLAPFILELPQYQTPQFKATFIHMWDKAVIFIKRAATVLLVGAVFVWFISTHPWGVGDDIENSYAGMIGKTLEPVFNPLGFDWRANVGLVTGFLAKEIVVGTFGILYGVGEDEAAIQSALVSEGSMTPLTAFAYMAFVLIYMPCLAVVGVIKSETGSWKWTAFSIVYGIALAYIVALAIVTVGGLFGL